MYMSHVAQVSDTAWVTRQVPLLGLNEREQGRKLVNTFLLHIIICCIGLCARIYVCSINCLSFTKPGYTYCTQNYVPTYILFTYVCNVHTYIGNLYTVHST